MHMLEQSRKSMTKVDQGGSFAPDEDTMDKDFHNHPGSNQITFLGDQIP